ncbi:hypothetical protein SAMN02787142_0217 [Burkholderia sp. WP9]|nr:hypothetical protein SAMN02787142_0217 [Burkholderia sp. WP9]
MIGVERVLALPTATAGIDPPRPPRTFPAI